jgi:L-ascorbate metabolism protein UlaG (beta-lactamase superfamily)
MRKLFLVFLGLSTIIMIGFNSLTWAEEPKITIHYEESAQFELINPEGTRVLIDVHDPSLLSSPATASDILLTTHSHGDHNKPSFVNSFPGKQLYIKTGELVTDEVKITGLSSAHIEGDAFLPEGGTNYIFVIDMAGLRIIHFGGIGQNALTPEQLKAIGEIDIALAPLSNSYSNMNIDNLKGFNLIDQVKPKLIIPTHLDIDEAKYAVKKWRGFYDEKTIKIGKSNLKGAAKFVMLGENSLYGKNIMGTTHW